MALVAKEDLRDGHDLIAHAGTLVSPAMVERYGWQDKVTEDGVTTSRGTEHLPKPTRRTPARRKR